MKHVIVIGGGIAGMQCAAELARGGIRVTVLEKQSDTGGKLRNWHKLFPSLTPAGEVLGGLNHTLRRLPNIDVRTECEAAELSPRRVVLATGEELECDAVVVATGFDDGMEGMRPVVEDENSEAAAAQDPEQGLVSIKPSPRPAAQPEQVVLGAKSTRYNNIEALLARPAYKTRNSAFVVQASGGRKEVLREEGSAHREEPRSGSLFD